MAWALIEQSSKGKPSLLGGATGAVAGLVAITPACGFAEPEASILLGLVAGVGLLLLLHGGEEQARL